MKRITRGQTSRLKKAEDVNKDAADVLPGRVLRSHKRKLAEAELNNRIEENVKRVCESKRFSDASDCVIVGEVIPSKVQKEENKILTSTPLRRGRSKKPLFNESCIKLIENGKKENESKEVIVLSDSSKSALPLVLLSDNEKSDNEIEVIPSTSQKEKNDICKGEKVFLGNINKNNNLLTKESRFQLNIIRNPNSSKKKKRRKKTGLGRENYFIRRNRKKNEKPSSQSQIGKNIYVENTFPLLNIGLRPIIIDGSNVAFHHSNNKYFSCKGLEICIKYFKKRGHEVIAFVPQYRLKIDKSDNPKLLDQLVKNGDVVLTPSRMVDGKAIVSYDDRFIVQTAAVKGGIIVTRDNYRDLLAENPAWAETIKYRLLQFTWVQDMLMFPNDPLGAKGPSLEEFLKFK